MALAAAPRFARRQRLPLGVAESRAVAKVDVHCCALADLDDKAAEWAQLANHALEPNVFLEPGFARPLLRREPDGIRFLLTRDTASGALTGLLPIRMSLLPLVGRTVGWRHELIAAGHPLLHRDRAVEALAAMLDWLACQPGRPAALVLAAVPLDGAFGTLLATLPARRLRWLDRYRRAALIGARAGATGGADIPRPSKEQKRLRRRLGESGPLTYDSATSSEAVAHAVEEFLLLEHEGWKGRRGTSLLTVPARATFVREMAAALAAAGKCRIDALRVGDRAIATGIVLRSGDRAYFWKTAFDETAARFSPGALFTADLALRQKNEAGIALTDSCAVPDHPMIDRLWPDRLDVADVAIALQPHAGLAWDMAVLVEIARRRCRATLKSLRNGLQRRRAR